MKATSVFLAATALWLSAVTASAQYAWPDVQQFSPHGGRRATEVLVDFRGRRLDGVQGLFLFREGLEVLKAESMRPNHARIRLKIAADCPLGVHPMRLRTDTGVGELLSFHVGTLPEVFEDESAASTGQEVPLDVTVNGSIGREEVDVYLVDVPDGARVTFEVEGLRLGGRALDTELEVRDPSDAVVLTADDSALGRKDPIATAVFEQGGRYSVLLRQAVPVAANVGPYRLHIGTFPRPTGAIPCGGLPGEELHVRLLGDPTMQEATVRLPDDGTEVFDFFPPDARGATPPTPIRLRVGPQPRREPQVAADAGEGARPLFELPGAVHGVLAEPGQRDRWFFRASRGQQIEFRVVARTLRSPLDPLLVARYENGRYISANDDAGALDSFLRFRAPADGMFSIEVYDTLRRGSPEHFYRIEGGAPWRPLHARVVVDRRRGDAVVAVPRGAHASFLLQCDNVDHSAGPRLLLQELPPGVEADVGPFVRGTALLPVVLTAAADAALGGGLASFAVEAEQEPRQRKVYYAQDVDLVRVENNRPYLRTRLRVLPVAVTASPPFRIDVEPPRVPLVRGGPMGLGVRVERTEGFTGNVRLRMLWNPPGTGSGRPNVPGNRGESVLPMNASGNAQLGTFRVAVVGSAYSEGGVIEVSSGFVDLVVEKPWITAQLGRVRVDAGGKAELRVGIRRDREVAKPITARLIGLPRGVSSSELTLDPEAAELVFPLVAEPNAPPGRHRGLRLRLSVPGGDGVILHDFGGGEIRVDRPVADGSAGRKEVER